MDGTHTIELKERRLNNQSETTVTTISTPFTVLLTPYDPQYSITTTSTGGSLIGSDATGSF